MQLSVQQAAQMLNVSEETIYHWIRNEKLPAARYGERFHINHLRLIEWAHLNHISFGSTQETDDHILVKALRLGGIWRELPGTNLKEVIESLSERFPFPPPVSLPFISQMLLSRQNAGWVSFSHGIAIPHARAPIICPEIEPVVSIIYLQSPIILEGSPGEVISVMVASITPTIRLHLHLLSRIGVFLGNEETVRLILEKEDIEIILESFLKREDTKNSHQEETILEEVRNES